jgi:hypothetical protein
MFDQLFDSFRKTSESALQTQQDLMKRWVNAWPSLPVNTPGSTNDWNSTQRRWLESMTELLNMHRGMLDSTYKAGIELIESTFRLTEARSAEDYRRLMEEVWRKLSETIKNQSDLQLRELQSASAKWMNQPQNNATAAS